MLERFEQGDQVNPSLPPRPGDDCIFTNQAADGTLLGLVKLLLRSSVDHWRVAISICAAISTCRRMKWSRAYRIAETRHCDYDQDVIHRHPTSPRQSGGPGKRSIIRDVALIKWGVIGLAMPSLPRAGDEGPA